ncbi:hypothetical protein L2E82_13901 [Cichorium intybus]|uniref:Uncharacterized protein n=1 Tax=Cichorium intybus TaxID=13427 RepID=A0ACB9EZ47_CICIN|nr:hypothetical protein L1887_33543 [Cichorium endivia]KAI3763903.1 hypothetical protein L2E82_13901 [Cichorium intybus]
MDYVFPSRNNETMLVSSNKEPNHENLDSNHDQEASLFGQFPLPFLDEISTSAILHNHHLSTDRSKTSTSSPANEVAPSPSKTKRVRKKRSAGKKDRHSKIHTAQGLRDRRMRLSLHIARKFFGLQDMLGFDKASKTIEWLFCKSKKAIEEVTEGFKSQNTTHSGSKENPERCQSPSSDCVVDSNIDVDAASNKGKQLKIQDEMGTGNSRRPTESDILARETRDKARARARERTRERMMINHLEKSKQMFGANPNDDFDQLQLGFSVNPSTHYIEKSSSSHLEYSGTHQFYEQPQLDGIAQKTEDQLGTTAASSSSYFSEYGYNKNFANPPAGWLNSSNTFLGFLGGWDSENFRMESENYGILPNTASSTGDIHEQSLTSVIIPHTNLLHFQSQHQRD